jgi:hypothetical protein
MRLIPVLSALALAAAAVPALAQPRVTPAVPPADTETPIPSIAESLAVAQALSAQLAALDAQISADEARATQLRDVELTGENARIRAIRPALKFHGAPKP